jgi:putative CocE/NonD family hydrolase
MSSALADVKKANAFNRLPLSKVDDGVIGKDVGFYNNWLHRPTIDKWPGAFRLDQVQNVKIPVLHISGLWDGDGVGTKLHWEALKSAGGNQWMIFGPWNHFFNTSTKFTDVEYGPTAILELDSVYVRFFDAYLKSKAVEQDQQPRVRMFVTGRNEWLRIADWPPPFSKRKTLYLAGGAASTSAEQGRLAAQPGGRTADRYVYNPKTERLDQDKLEVGGGEGGSTKIDLKDMSRLGPAYWTEAFTRSTVVSGPFDAELYVSTSARDATFHVLVVEKSAKGVARVLGMPGNHRMTWTPTGFIKIKPNQVVKLTIRPWEFAHEFKAGSRLGIIITSSTFPGFARNPGTGEPDAIAVKMIRANQSIHRSTKYPSRVTYSTFEL